MTGPNKVEIALSVDKREGESNLKAFSRAFDQLLRSLGKGDGDIKAFRRLAADVEAGKVAVASLDEQTRKLLQVFREGSQVAADRDLLGLSAHKDIQEQIYRTREAYERLAASGKLTSAELAQAALKTEERIRELHKETNGWADSLVNAKAALAGMAASAAGVTAVAVAGIKFESSMAAVNKVVGGTDEQIAALSKRLRELATEMPVEGGVNGLAAIAAMGGQLGVPIEKLEAFVTLAAKMGVAFNLSSEQSAKAVAELSNVFNLPLERVGELGDAVNALGNTMSAREGDIVDVLTRIGGSATQFNLTAEQSAALAASMLSLGMSSEVAGTGINAMLAKLQTAKLQGADFQAALAEMGVSANKLAKDIRANPQAALLEFLRTLKSLDGQSRAEVITRLFGLEYQDKISRLVAGLAQYEAALGRISSRSATAGAMEKEYQAQLKTTDAQIRLLRQSVEVAAINLGTVFLPALRSVVTMLGDAAAGVAKFIETFPEISALAATLGTVMVTAGSLRLVLLALTVAGTRGFGALFGAVKDLNVGLGDAIKNVGKLQTAFNLAGAAIVGWEIGSWAREEFKEVELAGIALAGGLTKLAERAQFAWFAYENKWSPKTVIDEYDRLQQRLKEIDDTYAEMFAEASNRPATPSAPPAPPLPAANLDKPATGAENLAGSLAKAREAAAELGVDLTKFSTSVSPEFEVLQTHLDALVAALPKLKESGVQTGAALKTALSQMIAGARNPAELLALTERIRELGAAGELSKPQLVSLFEMVRAKAKEATAEAAQLRGEIANLLAEAANVRNGTAGAGAKATERRERGLTDEERDALNWRRADSAVSEAQQLATFAQNAAIDGRAQQAQQYAARAAQLIQQASAYADKLKDDTDAANMFDRIAEAEARGLEAQAALKQRQLQDIEAASAAQAQQLSQLETRLQQLRDAVTTVKVDASVDPATAAIEQVKTALAALPDLKTITVEVVTKQDIQWSSDSGTNVVESLADALPARGYGGRLPGIAHGDRSDNVLYWGTPGEHVIQIPAVRYYGRSFIDAINNMRIPKHGYGGTIAAAAAPTLAAATGASDMVGANLVVPGVGSYPVKASADVYGQMQRAFKVAALKAGGRR